ncbi:acyltransferase family protein [Corynebacterium lowii]|uniref:acyltransferase family protein n=1 Tax=Corynebacterium lowii TaxID=1544413 RepID=UPI002480002D|nr:acyltransferase [Corynebacterium lowii]MDP9852542.1 peptidoglycan/LPS O-acetylase OafA/YrhL [Corynebacterium lowii]
MGSLEGLRAVAAYGVVLTHVAFQTGLDPATPLGAIAARFDFFVAVFFALSAFLLWRRHRSDRRFGSYYLHRCARILPAYWVCVIAVLLFAPVAFGASPSVVIAQLTLTQIYLPQGLIGGLTHLWSLCIEVAFYLILPLLVLTVGRLRSARRRIAVWVFLAAASLGWAWIPLVAATPANGWPNMQIWPPAYASWFAVGLIAAELEPRFHATTGSRLHGWLIKALHLRPLWWAVALFIAWVAGQEWFGPLGLEHPSPAQFTVRTLAGAAFAAVVVWPYALAPRSRDLLATPVARTLGRWSYSVFLWHVAVLSVVFPLLGIPLFSGHTLLVGALTLGLSTAVAAASYELMERPARRAFLSGLPSFIRLPRRTRHPSHPARGQHTYEHPGERPYEQPHE